MNRSEPPTYLVWSGIDYNPSIERHDPLALQELLFPPARILDLGCGKGHLACSLAEKGFEVTGIDINPEALALARRRSESLDLADRTTFIHADLLDFLPEEPFDAVILVRLLTCFPDRECWAQVLDRLPTLILADGWIDILDFAMEASNPAYTQRYRDGRERGWREGNFLVERSPASSFVAHHHTQEELVELFSRFPPVNFREFSSISMNGNPCRMFELLGRSASETRPKPAPAHGQERLFGA